MGFLDDVGDTITVSVPIGEDGLTGRQCPVEECEGYFSIQLGTGLTGEDLKCHCPYCGHTSEPEDFTTPEQIEYAQSVALNRITGALLQDLKAHEFDHLPPRGGFGIGMSLKVSGQPHPIRYYREKALETEIVCDQCTLRYAIYGVFAFCPDCRTHNSRQILDRNLALCAKELALAAELGGDLAERLIRDALTGAVASFDGYGRETCRVHAGRSTDPGRAADVSFQNLSKARNNVLRLFGCDLQSALDSEQWEFACRAFQKRHLVAHKMSVVDEAYLAATSDPETVLGRKVAVSGAEVERLVELLGRLSTWLSAALA